MAKRILIISAAIGGGHVAAAKALERSFLLEGADVKRVDLLDYTSVPFRRFYRQAYFDLVKTAPEFVDWLGTRLDRHPSEQLSQQKRLRARATRLISYHLPRLINRYKPDAIVHTHFLAPEILSTRLLPNLLRTRHNNHLAQHVVITDYFAHSLWLQANIDTYFVATDEVAAHLYALGIETHRVKVSGIPIDLSFTKLEPKELVRERLGYPDKDLLLLMASGLDYKVLEPLIKQLKNLKWPLTTVIICGRSHALADKLRQLIDNEDRLVTFDILGFSDNIPQLMAAADLLVGKPGGLTTSEALAANLPLAIVQPYPLQEEANTSFLLEHGAAFRIEPLTVFEFKLKRYLENPDLRKQMCQAAQSLAKPYAAQVIAKNVLDIPDKTS